MKLERCESCPVSSVLLRVKAYILVVCQIAIVICASIKQLLNVNVALNLDVNVLKLIEWGETLKAANSNSIIN